MRITRGYRVWPVYTLILVPPVLTFGCQINTIKFVWWLLFSICFKILSNITYRSIYEAWLMHAKNELSLIRIFFRNWSHLIRLFVLKAELFHATSWAITWWWFPFKFQKKNTFCSAANSHQPRNSKRIEVDTIWLQWCIFALIVSTYCKIK